MMMIENADDDDSDIEIIDIDKCRDIVSDKL